MFSSAWNVGEISKVIISELVENEIRHTKTLMFSLQFIQLLQDMKNGRESITGNEQTYVLSISLNQLKLRNNICGRQQLAFKVIKDEIWCWLLFSAAKNLVIYLGRADDWETKEVEEKRTCE